MAPRMARVSRQVVAAGVVGCSAAAFFYVSGISGVPSAPVSGRRRVEEAQTSSPPVGRERPGLASLPAKASSSVASDESRARRDQTWSRDGANVRIEDPLAAAIATHNKKSVRQRLKDSISRRRAQHKFPYNSWWKWKRRRQDVEDNQNIDELPGQEADGRPVARGAIRTPGWMPTTAEVAAAYAHVIDDIKLVASTLLQQDLYRDKLDDDRLAPRFDDLEITRYAIHYGLLRIDQQEAMDRNSTGYRMVVQDAAEGIIDSQEWFHRHEFASIHDLHKEEFADLIRWEYLPEKDQRPTLHVDMGKAVAVCVNKAKQKEFANVVLTMMELASLNSPLTGLARLPPGGIDRIDVAIYAKGTNTMNATSAVWILRAVVRTVSHHYPGRLNTLVLHDLPTFLNWVVLGVKKLVHPDTAKKFVVT